MIRRPTMDDFAAIYEMAEAYHKEYRATMKHAPFGFEWQKCASQIYNWLHAEGSINYIADHGCILGEIAEPWFSSDKLGQPFWCYVWPEYRNGIVFRSLVKAFVEEAKNRGAVYVIWDDANGMTDTRMLSKFLGLFGFRSIGNVNRLFLEENHHADVNSVYSPYCGRSGPALE
jgi:hypothetical protein